MATKRKYELKKRAERQEETRRRITEATVSLHETVGPARTQISEIARLAGVERLTVYKHFSEPSHLFAACSAHWEAQHPPPDPAQWAEIADPRQRVREALVRVYGYFAENEALLENVIRDAETLPALREHVEAGIGVYQAAVVAVLVEGWKAHGRRRERLATAVSLAVDFHTWRLLVRRRGLSTEAAAAFAAELVASAASK
jgi:AcrR family transcriptional regulator